MPNVNPRTGALSGQFDVFIPKEPMPDLGDLLKQFFQFCRNLGFRPTRREKKGGGHVTSWWCEFPLNDNAPSKSVVQFGETNYGELAPHMSMWGRASEGYYEPGRKLLEAFMDSAAEEEARLATHTHVRGGMGRNWRNDSATRSAKLSASCCARPHSARLGYVDGVGGADTRIH